VNFGFTDILMLNIAYSMDSASPLEAAILNRKNYNEETTKSITLMGKDVEADSEYYNLHNGTAYELIDFANGNDNVDEAFEYPRYWHGYLILLKPLLLIMNYNQIRYMIFSVAIILSIILSILIYKKVNMAFAITFILSVLLSDLLIASTCINTAFCFIIAIITSIYIAIKGERIKNIYLLFFFVGIMTNLFDLLTNPILTLGIPLVTYYMINKENNLKHFILILINWGMGYFGFWFIKWCITDMIFKKGVIENAVLQVLHRTADNNIGIVDLIKRLVTFSGNYIFILILFLFSCFLILTFKNKVLKKNIIYFLIACIPLIWFVVLKNHSAIHAFFTYRNFCVIIYSLFVGILMTQRENLCANKEK